MTTSSARARVWARTGGSGAADFVYDEAAGQDEDHEDDKAASGASSAHGSSDSEEESGGEGEVHHVRPRLQHVRHLQTLLHAEMRNIQHFCLHHCMLRRSNELLVQSGLCDLMAAAFVYSPDPCSAEGGRYTWLPSSQQGARQWPQRMWRN